MTGISTTLASEIKEKGAISFQRFMDLALYTPKEGYYERDRSVVGKEGDFITSVSVGGLFGELLGFQVAEWMKFVPNQAVWWVEAGAHDGVLSRDVLGFLRRYRPELYERTSAILVEPSSNRQEWQKSNLADFGEKVAWVTSIEQLPPAFSGVVFCNELLDAFPVRRLRYRNGRWMEFGVTLRDGQFEWKELELPEAVSGFVLHQSGLNPSQELLDALPDGFIVDACPTAGDWWQTVARRLEAGRLMTIDYGLEAEEFFSPSRKDGTLRGYSRHSLTTDLLSNPGAVDLTAHINFSQIRDVGEAEGLTTESFQSQEQFLVNVAKQLWEDSGIEEWEVQKRRQFITLTHPAHMGRSFKVLIQDRSG